MIVSTPREKLWAHMNNSLLVPWSEDFQAVGLVRNDCLCAVVGYNGFANNGCMMHAVIDYPAAISRQYVRAIFSYPFIQCGLKYVLTTVAEENERAVTLNKKVGFTEIHRFAGASHAGQSVILLKMTVDECRWIGDTGGKSKSSQGCQEG